LIICTAGRRSKNRKPFNIKGKIIEKIKAKRPPAFNAGGQTF